MSDLESITLDRFFEYYKSDIESEIIDNSNVVLSFPVHFSGFHRIEVTVTQISPERFILSDGAKVIDELKTAGYKINKRFKARLEELTKIAKIRIVNSHLVADCLLSELGVTLQRFLEAAKTIGDAYLVQRTNNKRDTDLIGAVSSFLVQQNVPFQTRHPLAGQYERHVIDFYFPPNGVQGLALSVMNNPTRMFAEAWAFRATDIKSKNDRTKVGVVYDDQAVRDNSKSILDGVLDVAVPSSDISVLKSSLRNIGILKSSARGD